jgi:hypothetical protein
MRARSAELCLAIGNETKDMIAQVFVAPVRQVQTVQALLMQCEYPTAFHPARGEDVAWVSLQIPGVRFLIPNAAFLPVLLWPCGSSSVQNRPPLIGP